MFFPQFPGDILQPELLFSACEYCIEEIAYFVFYVVLLYLIYQTLEQVLLAARAKTECIITWRNDRLLHIGWTYTFLSISIES